MELEWMKKKRHNMSTKRAEWFDNHKSIHISNEAHAELLKYAGMLQQQTGEKVSLSTAIEHLAKRVIGFMGGDVK